MNILVLSPNTPGLASQDLLAYVREHEDYFQSYCLIQHPVAPSRVVRTSSYDYKITVKSFVDPLSNHVVHKRGKHRGLLTYLIDNVSTIQRLPFYPIVYDFCIFLSPSLAPAAYWLKRKGKVKKVVYWALDYYPRRYGEKGIFSGRLFSVVEKVYRRLEKYAVKNADVLWTVTENMVEGWGLGGYEWSAVVRVVPHCIYEARTPISFSERTYNNSLLWAGMLREEHGFDLVVEAWPDLAGEFPGLRLSVASRTDIPSKYDAFLLRDDVAVLPFIESQTAFNEVVAHHAIGLAPYKESYKSYSDPARVRTYLGAGIPSIVSSVVPVSKEIHSSKSGRSIQPTRQGLHQAVVELLDPETNDRASAAAHSLAQKYLSDKIFQREFEILESLINPSR